MNKIILQDNSCSDATAQFCNRATGTRIVKVLHPHPTVLVHTVWCLSLQSGPSSTLHLLPALTLESGVAEEASSTHFPLSSRFVFSLQQTTRAEQLYAFQGFVDHSEFKDWIETRWKVPYCRRIERKGSQLQCLPN